MKAQSQRQLRAGELVRRAVADILREGHVREPALAGLPVTISEARVSPDLRHATVYVSALTLAEPEAVAAALNRASGFLQKELGRRIDMKFTPKLRFEPDSRFDDAMDVEAMLDRPGVRRDLPGRESD
ncbi:MAG: 30S ribosome-binding factor RbfA [Oceanicaulis sp.]|nr:30S ribosome-binding factor RbfA [Oceanicaulis sp.]